mgnify:CR=1 FL=1
MTALRPQLSMELWMLRPYLRQFGFVLFFGVMYTAFLEAGTPVMVVIGIQFPFFFGLGYNRARPVTFVSMFLVVGAVTMTYMLQSDGGVPTDLTTLPGQHPVGITVTGIPVGLAALAGSAAISVRLYWRKDL